MPPVEDESSTPGDVPDSHDHFEYVHLDGARFQGGVLPVSATIEFERYQNLVIGLAKHLYRAKHPECKRVTKKALEVKSFDIFISNLRDGSCGVDLSIHRQDSLMPAVKDYIEDAPDYWEDARRLIDSAFADLSQGEPLSEEFPEEFIPQLSRMGESLPPNETMTWAKDYAAYKASNGVSIDQCTTAPLREGRPKSDPVEVVLNAFIVGVCSEPLTFDYKLGAQEKTRSAEFSDKSLFPQLKDFTGFAEHSPLAALSVLRDPSTNRIVELKSVETALPADWVGRLAELSRLESGWLDSEGKAITTDALQVAEKILFDAFDLGLSRPGIFPTPQGGIHLEWDDNRDTEIEVHPSGQIKMYSDDLEEDGLLAETPLVRLELERLLS